MLGRPLCGSIVRYPASVEPLIRGNVVWGVMDPRAQGARGSITHTHIRVTYDRERLPRGENMHLHALRVLPALQGETRDTRVTVLEKV